MDRTEMEIARDKETTYRAYRLTLDEAGRTSRFYTIPMLFTVVSLCALVALLIFAAFRSAGNG